MSREVFLTKRSDLLPTLPNILLANVNTIKFCWIVMLPKVLHTSSHIPLAFKILKHFTLTYCSFLFKEPCPWVHMLAVMAYHRSMEGGEGEVKWANRRWHLLWAVHTNLFIGGCFKKILSLMQRVNKFDIYCKEEWRWTVFFSGGVLWIVKHNKHKTVENTIKYTETENNKRRKIK